MPTKKEVITALDESIAKLANLKVDELVNAQKLGSLSFEDGRDDFENLIGLCQELRAKPLDRLSIPDAQYLTQAFIDMKGSLEVVERFSLGAGSNEESRNAALARFRENWRSQNGRLLSAILPVEKGTSLEVWQPIAARIVTLSMLSFATIWSLRNYKTHRHLAIVNGHRHAALATFEAFANAARDDATKNSVLLEATRAIFALGNTGYLGAGEDDGVPSRVIEVMKLVGDSANKS